MNMLNNILITGGSQYLYKNEEDSEKVKSQKAVADECLKKIELIDPTAIVAGGAPRDWSFGNPATDVDLYFHFRNDLPSSRIRKVLEKLGFVLTSSKDGENLPEHYKRNKDLRCVFDTRVRDVDVQLMLMHSPTFNVVREFPLSICKAWYKNGRIYLEKEFVECAEHKVIKLTNEVYNDKSLYIDKILKKFPDWMYIE